LRVGFGLGSQSVLRADRKMESYIGLCNGLTIAATVLVSLLAFWNPGLEERYIFEPERILAGKEYHRLFTSALLHGDVSHLALNMISLYFFGPILELLFGWRLFLGVYWGAVLGGSLLALYVHRHHQYRAYGASGGVCGIIFAYLLLLPGASISPFFIPIAIPGWLYALAFLLGSFFALKAGRDNVGHDAHLGGAIIGFVIAAALEPAAVRYNLRVFIAVLGVSVALLFYLWVNPLFLPGWDFWSGHLRRGRAPAGVPAHRRESVALDAVLEKIAHSGFESLTEDEKALLEGVSEKFRRRADSAKPKSGLSI
jgi:membrane associated rhomboid family serine protease